MVAPGVVFTKLAACHFDRREKSQVNLQMMKFLLAGLVEMTRRVVYCAIKQATLGRDEGDEKGDGAQADSRQNAEITVGIICLHLGERTCEFLTKRVEIRSRHRV